MSYIEINQDKCKSCYLCIEACPKKLIEQSNAIGKTGKNTVKFEDENKNCLGCAQCAFVCPDLAIENVIKS